MNKYIFLKKDFLQGMRYEIVAKTALLERMVALVSAVAYADCRFAFVEVDRLYKDVAQAILPDLLRCLGRGGK